MAGKNNNQPLYFPTANHQMPAGQSTSISHHGLAPLRNGNPSTGMYGENLPDSFVSSNNDSEMGKFGDAVQQQQQQASTSSATHQQPLPTAGDPCAHLVHVLLCYHQVFFYFCRK